MERISELLDEHVGSIGIAGHVRPDGDCVGSCMGLYLYLRQEYPQLEVDVYLDHPKQEFAYIPSFDEIRMEADDSKVYDLFITCDVSSRDRIGLAENMFASWERRIFMQKKHFVWIITSAIRDLQTSIMWREQSARLPRCFTHF